MGGALQLALSGREAMLQERCNRYLRMLLPRRVLRQDRWAEQAHYRVEFYVANYRCSYLWSQQRDDGRGFFSEIVHSPAAMWLPGVASSKHFQPVVGGTSLLRAISRTVCATNKYAGGMFGCTMVNWSVPLYAAPMPSKGELSSLALQCPSHSLDCNEDQPGV